MGWGVGGAAVGEGTGGEAHELKQGAHDEEEEPVNCSTHTRTYAHWKTCTEHRSR